MIQVFWRKGFSDSSLQDLEKATGVNKSGLYSEFKDKDEIFLESLKHYAESTAVLELLSKDPLGWANIEAFLLLGSQATGQKGCLMANTVREISIIPQKSKSLIIDHMVLVKDAILKNLEAVDLSGNTNQVADLILTFNSGLCLTLNLGSKGTVKNQVSDFLNLLKKPSS